MASLWGRLGSDLLEQGVRSPLQSSRGRAAEVGCGVWQPAYPSGALMMVATGVLGTVAASTFQQMFMKELTESELSATGWLAWLVCWLAALYGYDVDFVGRLEPFRSNAAFWIGRACPCRSISFSCTICSYSEVSKATY